MQRRLIILKHEKLIQIIKKVGIPKNETQIITNLYFRQVARIQLDSLLSLKSKKE